MFFSQRMCINWETKYWPEIKSISACAYFCWPHFWFEIQNNVKHYNSCYLWCHNVCVCVYVYVIYTYLESTAKVVIIRVSFIETLLLCIRFIVPL